MRVEALPVRGALLLHGLPQADERGSFRRVVDLDEVARLGGEPRVSQVSTASNLDRGTVRGLHWSAEPHGEAKTLWCTRGSVFDVLVDLRPKEPSYGRPWSTVLRAGQPVALHVPRGVAHGYQTLEDGTDLVYLISAPYDAVSACSANPFDAALGIAWPLPVSRISDRDRGAPPWPPLS